MHKNLEEPRYIAFAEKPTTMLGMRELLEEWNPWWADGKVPERLAGIERKAHLEELAKQAGERRISVVTGPRRAGKTMLLHQVIGRLLSTGVKSTSILYAQMDHPRVNSDIGTVLREFRKINRLPVREEIIVFLDEVQYAKDWARWAKSIYDLENVKLFISGSTTALIENDAYASLTGRWRKHQVWPLSFPEFLEFKGVRISGAEKYLETSHLNEYIRTGGFPEAVLEDNPRIRSRELVELFDDMVFKDAARTRNIRDSTSLRQVAVFMAGAIGKPLSVNKMRNTFKLSAEAISGYIDALCSAYLFFPCPFYSRSVNERTYNPRKYYAIDPGMTGAVLGNVSVGNAVENLLALHYWKRGNIGYWKSNVEVDIVIGDGDDAIESKFKNDISPKDIRGGLMFAKKEKLDRLYVATDEYDAKKVIDGIGVHFVPITRILLGEGGPQ
jgi:hypothetical protein